MTPRPTSYDRAFAGRDGLWARFEESRERLKRSGRANALRSFRAILSRGRAAINMPVPKLVRFLEEGKYLSLYEFVARETGLSGEDLENALQDRLREFGPPRQTIDRLFRFQPDTHYASFNLGGAQPWNWTAIFRPRAVQWKSRSIGSARLSRSYARVATGLSPAPSCVSFSAGWQVPSRGRLEGGRRELRRRVRNSPTMSADDSPKTSSASRLRS